MRACGWPSLAIFLLVAAGPAAADDITVYRCKGGSGQVTVQDSPCASGQTEVSRSRMVRPQDPPPKPAPPPDEPPQYDQPPPPEPDYTQVIYPPPLYQCTDYDGEVRYSEDYDPSTRCVPMAVMGYASSACTWVQESCLLLDDASACVQYKKKLEQARSDALHAFSDTAPFRKSEVERLTRIVNDSCR